MAELSTSRINRQLRSLRMKCARLSTFTPAPTKPSVSVTYGSSSRNAPKKPHDDDGTPPLAILQSLDNFGARLHLDRAIVENMQLSKRIYEVRDAFRNIVQSVLGPHSNGNQSEGRRTLPLTSICARLIGEHVQSEVEAALDDLQDSDVTDGDLDTQTMEDLYDQVPPAYRPAMFITHTLSYILDACPHHPTLLNALLEVCLSHRLAPEAHTILSSFFATAIQPRSQTAFPCPLTHPAHKNFLTTLRESCSATSVVNDRTFTRLLVNELSVPSSTGLDAWTSKAVTRLARELRDRDFDGCFVPLCSGLVGVLTHSRPHGKATSKHARIPDDNQGKLYGDALERLAKWVISMLDRLHAPAANEVESFTASVEFLVDAAPHGLHICHDPPASSSACLADALVCLTTYCLASPHATSLHTHDLSVLKDILHSAHIRNNTLDGLISHIFPLPRFELFAMPLAEPEDSNTPTPPPPALPDVHGTGMEALSALAAPLRAHGLLKCEAALWLAALRHVEELIATPTVTQSITTPGRKLNQGELFNLRLELMDRVEESERRCFGGDMPPPAPGQDGEGEWVWEEMVGSWVLKSPAPALAKKAKEDCRAAKRRRVEEDTPVRPRNPAMRSLVREVLVSGRARASVPLPSRNTVVTARRETVSASASACPPQPPLGALNPLKRKASSASISSARSSSRASSSSSKENHAKENHSREEADVASSPIRLHAKPARKSDDPLPRRQSNFATILADAQTNVMSLRAEREALAKARPRGPPTTVRIVKGPSRPPFPLAPPPMASISAPPAPVTSPIKQRKSNFATLLADSQRNVISLREERARKAQHQAAAPRYGPSKRDSSAAALAISDDEDGDEDKDTGQMDDPESSPARGRDFDAMVHPSSDDALNLFAYPDSSPVRRR
ncbi:hypothetical protein C8Q77DRAFT_1116338 [Trametes polyzona]|nr:hypothetical protein C8Q77DRAFT_1116338 [Trametes polyzona]